MNARSSIRAVTVTQNTSQFVELMLRTLFSTNAARNFDLRVTVLDNNSDDEGLADLKSYLSQHEIPLIPTGFPRYVAAELHGAALTDFVRNNSDCTHYLFLDADMWFVEHNTIGIMLTELCQAPTNTFAVQARIYGYYQGLVYEGRDGVPGTNAFDLIPTWPIEFEGRRYKNRYMPRCSPVCSLIANTKLFREVVDAVGLTQSIRFSVGEVFYYDTFGLMTQVMGMHGQQFIISDRTVHHFTQTTYLANQRSSRESDCAAFLVQARAAERAS